MKAFKPVIQGNPPTPVVLTQNKFNRGVYSIVDRTNLPKNALERGDNITLVEDGAPKPRPGVAYYGSAATETGTGIDGAAMHVMSDETVHLLKISNGTVYRSTNDGATWTACTGATLTAGKKCDFEQADSSVHTFICNGYDYPVRYDGTTNLEVYATISAPVGSSLTKTGLAGTTYTYRYRVSAVNDVGYTVASAALTIQTDRTRSTFDSTNYTTFTWGAVTGAVRYDVYVGQTAGEETYIDSVENATTYIDQGQSLERVDSVAPDSDTTSGPRVGDFTLVGTRIYATADRDNPWRVWISAPGRNIGQFSSAFDAAYIDLQEGSQFRPVKTVDYRDGKGTPLATVFCRSKDGLGCVWQGTLESFTVGDVTFPVPNFYKLPGSRGTDAPFSVINVENDYMYYNSQAFYNLGSRAQFLNLLSTDESSANIRPDVKAIRQDQSHKICSHYQDAKVYFSAPVASDDNDTTFIFDTERKAWMPKAFTIGFERFFRYTDTAGGRHLLCWKTGDYKLSEISENIRGDYGEAFQTVLSSGLIHVNPRNRMEFIWCEEVEVEFAQPRGEIEVELAAITREEGFKVLETITITPDVGDIAWSTTAWSTTAWSDTSGDTIVSYSEPTVKRYFSVQQDVNAYQITVRTNSLDADYVLRTLQINGTATQAGKPRDWEVYTS